MMQSGTIVNGMVVFDGPAKLPEGTRVDVLLSEDWGDVWPPLETPEDQLAGLREALEDIKAGRTRPADEAMEDIRKKLDLPPFPAD